LTEDWRSRVKQYVASLVHLRTSYDALAVNDTDFIHVDFNDNKRVLVWRRGIPASDKQVVVLANFSDFATENAFSLARNTSSKIGQSRRRANIGAKSAGP